VKYLILTLAISISFAAECCINEYRMLLDGTLVETDAMDAVPYSRTNDMAYLLKQLHDADSIYKITGRLEDYSDYAALLVYTGEYAKAKEIFQFIELKSPGRYQSAANLGTTYELLGQNDSAYFWINKAIQINPHSHHGSEWIHLKILEAKMKANGNEDYFMTNSILNLDFGTDKIPENKNSYKLAELTTHLQYQLGERMSFIKPKDPVVAQLLFDLGNTIAIFENATSGLEVYEKAKEYGYSTALFEKRYSYVKGLQVKADIANGLERTARQPVFPWLLVISLSLIVIVGGGVIIYKRRTE
jgi:tetratricopeptide (TPR) repeat protein